MVMAAIVGSAGLVPTLAAAKAGKKLLLANKESLVMSGALFMETVRESGAELIPIDSDQKYRHHSTKVEGIRLLRQSEHEYSAVERSNGKKYV